MKKIISLLLLTIIFSLPATSKDTSDAVTMVSYEQGFMDNEGTLALRNNTDEDIHNVSFRITYLNMKGVALDYKDFSLKVNIAPGMTKKADIPAYEHDRYYSYYLSEAHPINPHRFKIKFDLKGYNAPTVTSGISKKASAAHGNEVDTLITSSDYDTYTDIEESSTDNKDDFPFAVIGVIVAALFVIGIYIGIYVLVAMMANKRDRNVALWVLVAFFATPVLAIIILLCLGKKHNEYEDYERE